MITKNKIMKKLALFLALAMMLTTFPLVDAGAFAYAAGTATINSQEGLTAEAGGTVTVPINLSNNPGIMGMGLVVTYDKEVLTPQSVATTDVSNVDNVQCNDSIETSTTNSFRIYWAAGENMNNNGTMFNVTFKVSPYAEGNTEIQLAYSKSDTYDENFDDVTLNCSPVTINVTPKASTVTTIKSSANQSVNAGEEIVVPIIIDNVDKVSSLSFDLKYDSSAFTEASVANGLGTCTASSNGQQLSVDATGIDTSVSSGTLCTVTFKTKEYTSGNYVFDLSSDTVAAEDFQVKVINTHASENAVIYGQNVNLSGNELSFDVSIKNNHGLAAFRIFLNYDKNVLTPVSVTKNAALSGSFGDSVADADGSFYALWFSSDNYTQDSKLFSVKFTVKDGATGTTQIGLDYNPADTCDEQTNDVILTMENIDVTLSESGQTDEEAAEEVVSAINNMDPSDADSVAAARAAYDALTDEQKALVDPAVLKKLTDAEAAIAQQEADQQAANQAIDAINNMDPSDADSVATARAAYDALTDEQKALVDPAVLKKLTDAEAAIAQQEADQQAAADVTTTINTMDPTDSASVAAARTAYNALTDAQKELIDPAVLKKLTDAEAAINQQEYDQQIATAAENTINNMDPSDADSVAAARAAYDALTDEQKALVDPDVLKKLTDAEAAIAQQEADQQAANQAIDAINNMDPADADSVAAARAAYDALTNEQKALVDPDVLKKLTDAEDALPQDKIDLSTLDFAELPSFEWNGMSYDACSYSVMLASHEFLHEGTDYEVTYINNDKVGIGTAILTGVGKYTGSKELQFEIKPLNLANWSYSFELSASKFTYNGKVKTPILWLKDDADDYYEEELPIPSRSDYSISCSTNRKSVGSHKIKYVFKGNFTGTITRTIKINPKGTSLSKLVKGKKSMTVKWKRQSAKMSTSRITGYQIRYSLKSSMKSAKMVKVKGYKTVSKKIRKLKAKKKYYVQIRTYKVISGKTYYSSWSKKKAIRVN